MPMTFPAHQGLILPVVRRWPNSFDALALSVGAAMPDITDTVLGLSINGYFKQWYGHALLGMFTLDLAGGVLITWFLAVLVHRIFKGRDVPAPLRALFAKALSDGGPRWQTRLVLWSFSVFIGILSHIGFDLISHDTNLLFYPWYENPHWYPGWWYTTWFVVRPLSMFGESYSVGIFSIIWGLLTVLGVFLFVRFVSSKGENTA